MRNVTLILLLISVTIFVNAQTWCSAGSTYNYDYFPAFGQPYTKTLRYVGDTTINAQICKKVVYNNNSFFTFLHADTVFVYVNQTFEPIYFFNAQVGDSIKIYSPNDCGLYVKQVVDSAGITVINGEALRWYVVRNIDETLQGQFMIPYPLTMKVIERKGAIDNYFVPNFVCCIDCGLETLCSYNAYNFTEYKPNYSINCQNRTSLELNEINVAININPNPVYEFIHLQCPQKIDNFSIYDINGKQVLYNKDLDATNNTLNIEHLPNGIYIYVANTNKGRINGKFIKQF